MRRKINVETCPPVWIAEKGEKERRSPPNYEGESGERVRSYKRSLVAGLPIIHIHTVIFVAGTTLLLPFALSCRTVGEPLFFASFFFSPPPSQHANDRRDGRSDEGSGVVGLWEEEERGGARFMMECPLPVSYVELSLWA